MKGKWINLILSILLIAYMVVSYVLSDGNQLLYGVSSHIGYIYIIVLSIVLYSAIYYGKLALLMYKSNHKYKAIYILLLEVVMLLLFIYLLIGFI